MQQCELSIGTFDDWYKDYPRKEAKLDAQKAYAAALKSGVTHERMAEGLKRYIAHLEANGTVKQYIKLPATWIRKGCYDDEYEPPKKKGWVPFEKMTHEDKEFAANMLKKGIKPFQIRLQPWHVEQLRREGYLT